MAGRRIIIESFMPCRDADGLPVSGARMTFYQNLTTTPATVYQDAALTIPHASPVEANGSGVFSAIYGDETSTYTVSIADSAGAPIFGLRNLDNIRPSVSVISAEGEAAVSTKAELQAITAESGEAVQMLGRTSVADGAGGSFIWRSGNQSANVTADPLGGVWVPPTAAPTGASGAWERVLPNGVITPRMFGALGDGSTNDTAAFTACINYAAAVGMDMHLEDDGRTYIIDPLIVSSSVYLNIPRGVTIKLKNSASLVSSAYLFVLRFTAANSGIRGGGTIDFNRANQGKAAFNTAGGSAARYYYGVHAYGSLGTPLEGFECDARIINAADFGFYGYALTRPRTHILIEDCGAGAHFVSCTLPSGSDAYVETVGLDNDGWKVYPHSLDLTLCTGGEIVWNNVDHWGSGNPGAGTSLSDWITGLTMVRCEDVRVSGALNTFSSHAAGSKGVGLSIMSSPRCVVEGLLLKGWTDSGIEFDTSQTTLRNILVDGDYRTALVSITGWGVQAFNSQFPDDFLGRFTTGPNGNTFENVRAIRCLGPGWRIGSMSGSDLLNCGAIGCQYGYLQSWSAGAANSTHFPSAQAQPSRGNRIRGGVWSYNEVDGIRITDGQDTIVENVICLNNGQAVSNGGVTRIGTSGITTGHGLNSNATVSSGLTKSGNVYRFIRAWDDQTSLNQFGSASPDAPTKLTVPDASNYGVGQWLNLNGCGTAGADLVCYVVDIDGDVLTLSTSILTFPTTAGTGTISTSGTTITGSGTNFLTSLQKRAYIKNGSNYRLVVSATTNTAGVLQSAFPSNLSGASFDIVAINVDEIRSQHYGIALGAADERPLVTQPDFGTYGNLTANYLDNTTAATAAWIEMAVKPMWIPAGAWAYVSGAAIAGGGSFRVTGWALDASSNEQVHASVLIPADGPKRVKAKAYWINNGAGSGDVRMSVSALSVGDGETVDTGFSGASGGAQVVTAPAQNVTEVTEFGLLTVTPGKPLHIIFLRGASDVTDTLANDILFLGMSLEAA